MSVEICFSVIIPLYNKAEFVSRTIDSVLSQSVKGFEVIVIDDGSTDNSGEVVSKYNDPRIRLIQQKNAGVSAARNTGIRNAKNEFIAFLDADDWWDCEYLSTMAKLILAYPNEKVFSAKFANIVSGKPYSIPPILGGASSARIDLVKVGVQLGELPVHTSSVVFQIGTLLHSGCFDERISFYEDYDLFLRIAHDNMFVYSEDKVVAFYNGDVPPEKKLTGRLPAIQKHLMYYIDKYKDDARRNPSLKLFLDVLFIQSLVLYYRKGKSGEYSLLAGKWKCVIPLRQKFLLMLPSFFSNMIIDLLIVVKGKLGILK